MDHEKLQQLLRKYECGDLSPHEREELDTWYEALEAKDDDLHLLYLRHIAKEETGQRIYGKIEEKIKAQSPRRVINMRWVAAVSMIVVSVVFFFSVRQRLYQQLLTITSLEIEVPNGALISKTLPDGSRAWLRAGSKLSFNRYFWGDERRVYLEGEGFFEVTQDKDKPFVVHSGKMQTKVLGTSFDVKAIPELQLYEVAVKTGKVQVSDSIQVLAHLLPAGHFSIRAGAPPKITQGRISGEGHLAWIRGELHFDNQSFEEIAWYLERLFDVDIHFSNTVLTGCQFSGDFTGLSLPQILKTMREVHPFELSHDSEGRKFLIKGEVGCNSKKGL